jgi:hypothetical protein
MFWITFNFIFNLVFIFKFLIMADWVCFSPGFLFGAVFSAEQAFRGFVKEFCGMNYHAGAASYPPSGVLAPSCSKLLFKKIHLLREIHGSSAPKLIAQV